MSIAAPNQDLLSQIRRKRTQVETFLAVARPRRRRLLNTPDRGWLSRGGADGGPRCRWSSSPARSPGPWASIRRHRPGDSFRASVCSIMATVATQLLKSDNIEEHVTRAQACRAKLEVLEVGLTVGELDVRQATTEYLKCVEEASFLEA